MFLWDFPSRSSTELVSGSLVVNPARSLAGRDTHFDANGRARLYSYSAATAPGRIFPGKR